MNPDPSRRGCAQSRGRFGYNGGLHFRIDHRGVSISDLLQQADLCVKCGLCLPHCPTYRLSGDEGESPRGRIALVQGWAQGRIGGERLYRHLDRCLGCRNCERMCPSEVPYGRLLAETRIAQRAQGRRAGDRLDRLVLDLMPKAPFWGQAQALLKVYQKGPARVLAAVAPQRIRRLNALMPADAGLFDAYGLHPAIGDKRGRVGLFTGCVGRMADRPALAAAIRVLRAWGFEVWVPAGQRCCGALDLHQGDQAQAEALATINRGAFEGQGLAALIGVASGCTAHLAEYDQWGAGWSMPVRDISDFLAAVGPPQGLELRPVRRKVSLHTPCSLRNSLRAESGPARLLALVPGLEVEPLDDGGLCCGAAGGYLVLQPEMAERLREAPLEALRRAAREQLLTSNTGCKLHLAAGLRQAGLDVRVAHPAEVAAEAISAKGSVG